VQAEEGYWHLLAASGSHKCGIWMLTSWILSAPHLTFPSRAAFQQVLPSMRGRSHCFFARLCGSPRCLRAAGCSSHTRAAMKMLCYIMQTNPMCGNCSSGTTGLAELKRRLPISDTSCSGLAWRRTAPAPAWHRGMEAHGSLRSLGVWVALAPLSLKRIDDAVAQRRAK